MEKFLFLYLIISLNPCEGGTLTGLLFGAQQEIHNKVHDVADAVLGGLSLVHGGHQRRPPPAQPQQGGETIVLIVEETPGRPQLGPPQHHRYPPPNGHNPNRGHNPNNGYYQGNENNGHYHGHHNQGHYHNGYHPQQNYPVNPGQGPQQHSDVDLQGNGNYGHQQTVPSLPNQQGQYNNGQSHSQYDQNNIANPAPTGNPTNVINPNPTTDEINTPEQKPNSNDNYKPTEIYNNDKTSKKPEGDGPLFVPLNDYTYGGDKIVVNAPKRDTNEKEEESDDDFPIDIRVKDE